MDLKNMFDQKAKSRETNLNKYRADSQRTNSNRNGQRSSQPQSVLNRFRKKTEPGKATPGQFKKYMLEANNIFFQNRPELKKLQELKGLRWVLIIFWLFLATTYFLIGRLQSYAGECPKHARCGVFIHCADFFEYDPKSHSCVLSEDIAHQIRTVSEAQVIQLQYNYGDNECQGVERVPSLNIETLFSDVDDPLKKRHYQSEANAFFKDPSKQKEIGFTLEGRIVEPTIKLYSLSCQLNRFFSNPHRQLDLIYTSIGLVGVLFVARWINKRRRISKMYSFLRDKVLTAENQTLNVTHAMADLQAKFGIIDEQTWDQINDLRTQAKEIGYYEDDFLYWKKM